MMANRYRNLIYSTAEYTHTYRNFRGIERSASSITGSPSRLAYSQNMYKDYDGDGSDVLESIPGFRCFAFYGRKIHAIYYQRSPFGREDHLLVHVGDKIMRHPISDIRSANATGVEIATVRDGKSFGFEYGRCFYIMDTEKLLQIIKNNSIKSVKIVRMEVPCCSGIENAAKRAIMASGKFIPWQVVTISTDGKILE
jgi:hypothetical protein